MQNSCAAPVGTKGEKGDVITIHRKHFNGQKRQGKGIKQIGKEREILKNQTVTKMQKP